MLPADWSISISRDPLPSSCYSKKMLWNPSIGGVVIGRDPCCEIKIMKILLEQGFEDLRKFRIFHYTVYNYILRWGANNYNIILR